MLNANMELGEGYNIGSIENATNQALDFIAAQLDAEIDD